MNSCMEEEEQEKEKQKYSDLLLKSGKKKLC